jgi:hypothetical protein
MSKKSHFATAAIALATLATVSIASAPANAAVICTAQGCVAAAPAPIVAPIATTTVAHVAYGAPVGVTHAGYTRVTPYGVRHVGYTRVWR